MKTKLIFIFPYFTWYRYEVTRYFATGSLNTENFLTTFIISYLMECEGFEKDDIELNGNLILDNKFCNDQNNNLSDGYSNVTILFPLIVFLLRCVCWLASLSVVIISNRFICTCNQLNWEDSSTSVFNKFSSTQTDYTLNIYRDMFTLCIFMKNWIFCIYCL